MFRLRDLWLLAVAGIAPIWTQWLVGTWGPALFAEVGVKELGRSAVYASVLGIAAPPGLLGRTAALLTQRPWALPPSLRSPLEPSPRRFARP